MDPVADDDIREDELHIAGLVVLASVRRLHDVIEAISTLPDTRIHSFSPAGRLVVTTEAIGGMRMTERIEGIQRIDGVLSASLVYHCADSLAAMNEEIGDDDDPTRLS